MLIPYKFRYIGEDRQAQDIEFDFPTAWDDLTFSQGRKILDWYNTDPDDVFALLAILSKVDRKIWFNAIGPVQDDIFPRLDFLKEIPNLDEIPFPKKITIDGKEITLPKNLQVETWGQKTVLQDIINKNLSKPDATFTILPWAVAVYAFPAFYNEPVDSKKLITFYELVNDAKFLDVYSAGKFFFLKSLTWLTGNRKI